MPNSLRVTRAEARAKSRALLFFTINFNNFTFFLPARGSEEIRTTARGLNKISQHSEFSRET